jgi:hypothetical protein
MSILDIIKPSKDKNLRKNTPISDYILSEDNLSVFLTECKVLLDTDAYNELTTLLSSNSNKIALEICLHSFFDDDHIKNELISTSELGTPHSHIDMVYEILQAQ